MPGSPMLTEERFLQHHAPADPNFRVESLGARQPATETAGFGAPPRTVGGGRTMTVGGTVAAAALMLAVMLATGAWAWGKVVETVMYDPEGGRQVTVTLESPMLFFGAMLVAFVLALVSTFSPKSARFTALPYAAAEGVVLGIVSHLYEASYQGIVVQAVLATVGVATVMLVLHSLRILRVTPRMTRMIVGATFGIALMYLIGFVGSFLGADLFFINSPSPLGILISVVIAGVAAFNLLLDFEMIERGSKEGLPAHYEWYCAVGLMVTLVWLYLEMLRLLGKIRSN